MALPWGAIKVRLVENNPLRYTVFVARWLWQNRHWNNSRKKWKALDRAWADHERERNKEGR